MKFFDYLLFASGQIVKTGNTSTMILTYCQNYSRIIDVPYSSTVKMCLR